MDFVLALILAGLVIGNLIWEDYRRGKWGKKYRKSRHDID